VTSRGFHATARPLFVIDLNPSTLLWQHTHVSLSNNSSVGFQCLSIFLVHSSQSVQEQLKSSLTPYRTQSVISEAVVQEQSVRQWQQYWPSTSVQFN